MPDQFDKLKYLLRKRIEIIANQELRDNDPHAHLIALKEISESIEKQHHDLQGDVSPQLEHFLDNRSYNKALKFLEKTKPN